MTPPRSHRRIQVGTKIDYRGRHRSASKMDEGAATKLAKTWSERQDFVRIVADIGFHFLLTEFRGETNPYWYYFSATYVQRS